MKTKIKEETLPVKYYLKPNKKGRKYLSQCFGNTRFIYNWILGFQNDYYEAVSAYSKEQNSEYLTSLPRDTEVQSKFYASEFKRLRDELILPYDKGVEILKTIRPNIDELETERCLLKKVKDEKTKKLVEAVPKQANKAIAIINAKRQIKSLRTEHEWLNDAASGPYYHAALNLDEAWKAFFDKRQSDTGKPSFKGKWAKQSCTFDGLKVDFENNTVKFPLLKKSPQKFKAHRIIDGELKTATVERTKTGKYFIIMNFRQSVAFPEPPTEATPEKTLGIDLGVGDNYLTKATGKSEDKGEIINNPRFLKAMSRKKKRLDRNVSRKKHNSKNWLKAKKKSDKLSEKLANLRDNFQHQLSHKITNNDNYSHIVMETLDLKGMSAKKKAEKDENGTYAKNGQGMKRAFNRATLDASLGSLVQKLKYKSQRRGKLFTQVDKYFPSTQLCHLCDYKNENLAISTKEFECGGCGTHLHRDVNACKSLVKEGVRMVNPTPKKKKSKAK